MLVKGMHLLLQANDVLSFPNIPLCWFEYLANKKNKTSILLNRKFIVRWHAYILTYIYNSLSRYEGLETERNSLCYVFV